MMNLSLICYLKLVFDIIGVVKSSNVNCKQNFCSDRIKWPEKSITLNNTVSQ